jgi:2,5-diketo-D-gluconate reductase B
VKFLQDNGIHITAYMSLAYGEVIGPGDPGHCQSRHQATPAQIALARALQQGSRSFRRRPSANLASNLERQRSA